MQNNLTELSPLKGYPFSLETMIDVRLCIPIWQIVSFVILDELRVNAYQDVIVSPKSEHR